MNRLASTVLALVLAACVPGTGFNSGPEDDEGVRVLDDGFRDAGPTPDAGDDGGPVFNPDGGFPFPFDAGVQEYEGAPEPGVRCGAQLNACGPGASCCVGGVPLVGTCSATGDEVCPAELATNLQCDGPEDCVSGDAGPPQACCLGGDVATGLTTTCQAPAACLANEEPPVCTSTAECPVGLTCCGLVGGFFLPIDLGVCSPVCALP
jgi:hypothetical protein